MTFCSNCGKEMEVARLSVVLLLFALAPLTATIQGVQNKSYASMPLSCQPGVQNEYPENANAGQKIVIITTVTTACVSDDVYNEVIVNILPPNSSIILSTAPASPATNTVTAPATAGTGTLSCRFCGTTLPQVELSKYFKPQ